MNETKLIAPHSIDDTDGEVIDQREVIDQGEVIDQREVIGQRRGRGRPRKQLDSTDGEVIDSPPLDLLEGYLHIDEIARAARVHPRTIRRRINQPNSRWSYLMWGGKIYLHVSTVRKLIEAEETTRNPRRGAR